MSGSFAQTAGILTGEQQSRLTFLHDTKITDCLIHYLRTIYYYIVFFHTIMELQYFNLFHLKPIQVIEPPVQRLYVSLQNYSFGH